MRKTLLSKFWLLLLCTIVGVNSAWADETTTCTFSSKSWAADNGGTWTSGKDGNQLQSGRGVQITNGETGANGTSGTSFTGVSKIVVTYSTNASKGAGSISVQVGTGTAKSQDVTKTGGTTDRTLTYNFSPYEDGKVKITVTCSQNSIYVKSVAITCSNGASISVDPTDINASFAESEGTIDVTYNSIESNPEIIWYNDQTAKVTSTEPDWISVDFDKDNNIEYLIDTNTGVERTAYFKVHGLDGESKDVYSDLISITQAEYAAYVPATSIVSGKHYIIVGENEDNYYAMGGQNSNNRAGVSVTLSSGMISTAEGVSEFTLYGPDANGRYTIYDKNASGYLYAASSSNNHLKTQKTNDINGKWSISINTDNASIVADGSSNRNIMRFNYNSGTPIFSCYANNSQSEVYLFEKDGEATPTINVSLAASGYASYCSPLALDLTPTEDYAAWAVTNATKSTVTFTKITGAVPAETPFILYGQNKKGETVTIPAATGETTAVTGNMLKGTLVATEVTTVEGDYTNFGLSAGSFVKLSNGTIPANKAYLPILTSIIEAAGARLSIIFEDEATGISTLKTFFNDNKAMYNLKGQRIDAPRKGEIYIMGGKKMVKK